MKARTLIVAVVVGAFGIAAIILPVSHWLCAALAWSAAHRESASVPFVLLYVASTVAMLPEVLLTIAAGAIFGLVRAMVLVSIGSTLGALTSFLLGRTLAREWVRGKIERWPRFQALDRAIAAHGIWMVFLTRLSPAIPFNLLNYAYGITAVRTRDYVIASWVGMLPGTLLYTYAGAAAANVSEAIAGRAPLGRSGSVLLWVGLIATLGVTVLVTYFARKELARQIESQ
ncbi:MAG: TVP38/TMEM64 family protein [Proteobacteria bacterium]|nr:TVP38/TMEM64 family protein [Pseudomonadota bacterium]